MPGSAYSDPPTFVPNQTLTASQQNALGNAIRALKWWTAGGSMPYAYDTDQIEELVKPARAALLQHNATIPSWLTVAASGADANKIVRVNIAGTAFELGAGGIVVASHSNASGYDYSTDAWRNVPSSNNTIVPLVTSTVVCFGGVVAYGTGSLGFRQFKFQIGGTDIDSMVSVKTYDISENDTLPIYGIKTGVTTGSKTIRLRETAVTSGSSYHVDALFWIALAIPE